MGRDQRLKQALKDNLQRRKAQARARSADEPTETGIPDTFGADGAEETGQDG